MSSYKTTTTLPAGSGGGSVIPAAGPKVVTVPVGLPGRDGVGAPPGGTPDGYIALASGGSASWVPVTADPLAATYVQASTTGSGRQQRVILTLNGVEL